MPWRQINIMKIPKALTWFLYIHPPGQSCLRDMRSFLAHIRGPGISDRTYTFLFTLWDASRRMTHTHAALLCVCVCFKIFDSKVTHPCFLSCCLLSSQTHTHTHKHTQTHTHTQECIGALFWVVLRCFCMWGYLKVLKVHSRTVKNTKTYLSVKYISVQQITNQTELSAYYNNGHHPILLL